MTLNRFYLNNLTYRMMTKGCAVICDTPLVKVV